MRTLKTVAVANSREVPVLGSVPGVFARIPHPKPQHSSVAPITSCASFSASSSSEQLAAPSSAFSRPV